MPLRKRKAGHGPRESRPRPRAPRRTVEMLERRDLLALVVAPLSLTEDVPFNGRIATFAGSDLHGSISDFKPSISWGDGTTSTLMNAQIVPDGTGFDVVAPKTYTQFGNFPVAVTVTGTNNSSVFGTGSAAVADAPLTPTGTTFTATAGQFFSGVVGSFQDVNGSSTAGDFSVRIDWGDGQTSLGSAAPATTGQVGTQRYNVSGSHPYANVGTDAVKFTIVRLSSGQTAAAGSTANVIAPTPNIFFTGGLDPLSSPKIVRGFAVTSQQEPVLSGTAAPGASVSLSLRHLGLGDPLRLGETVADPSGHWRLVVGPLGGSPFLLYGVATPVNAPPSPTTLLNGGVPIFVTNRPLHAIDLYMGHRGRQPRHHGHQA